MTFEDNLAEALQASGDRIPVGTPPLDTVIQRGKVMRRRRQVARTAMVSAALLPAVLAVVLSLVLAEHDTPLAGPSSTTTTTTPTSAVRVVEAGERLDLGRGNSLWLTKSGQLVTDTPGITGGHLAQPVKVLDPNTSDESISVQLFGENAGMLYVGFYRGRGKLAKVMVQSGGVTLNAKVVTLAGNPGWAAFYADWPTPIGIRGTPETKKWLPSSATVTGYAANGDILARLKDAPG